MTLLLVHTAATWFMVGLIWFVQVVHYPMFDRVGGEAFAAYEAIHQRLTTWVVLPVMLLELLSGGLLLPWRPAGVPAAALLGGLVLLGGVWAVTFLCSVPQHRILQRGFDATAHRRLVRTNWLRTAGWTARGVLCLWMAFAAAQAG